MIVYIKKLLIIVSILAFSNCTNSATLKVRQQGAIQLQDLDNSNFVELKSPAVVSSNVTWILPGADGTSGQVIQTNGSATLSFTTISAASLVVVTKTSSDILETTGEEIVVCDATSGVVTLTLPAVSGNSGLIYRIHNKVTANSCIIDGNSSETIDSALTVTMSTKHDLTVIFTDGVAWFSIGGNSYEPKPISYETNAGLSLTTGVWTVIDYEDTVFDDNSDVTIGSGWKYTVPKDGYYTISAQITFNNIDTTSAAVGLFGIRINKNSGTLIAEKLRGIYSQTSGTSDRAIVVDRMVKLVAADIIQVEGIQTSGGSLSLDTTPRYNKIDVIFERDL